MSDGVACVPVTLVDPEFRERGIEVWRVDLDASREPTDEAVACLVEAERERLARFHQVGDRARFAWLRATLRQRLGRMLGLTAVAVPIRTDASGKPRLPDDRLWFNVAHSGDHGLIAISPTSPVGVDIERARGLDRLDALAEMVLSEAERPIWLAEPPDGRLALFLRAWTAKEAVLKAVGTGLGTDLKALSVLGGEGRLGVQGRPAELGFDPAQMRVGELPAPGGYAAALAVLADR